MQGQFGKNTWKVKLAGIVGKLLVVACICGVVAAGVWLVQNKIKFGSVSFGIDFLNVNFVCGILELLLAVALIICIIGYGEWSECGWIIGIGVIGAIVSAVAYAVFDVQCSSYIGVFITAAVLAKLGLKAISLWLDLFLLLAASIVNFSVCVPEEVQDFFAHIIDTNSTAFFVCMGVPLVLIAWKIHIHDR